MSLLVCRVTSVWQGIVRVLWMFLVEDIVLAVCPARERSLIRCCLLDRLRWSLDLFDLRGWLLTLLSEEASLVGCRKIHVVRIDDL